MAAMNRAALLLSSSLLACAASPTGAVDEAKVEAKVEAKPELGERAATLFEDEQGNYGYRGESGEIVIPAQYPIASEFAGEVASVAGEQGWVFIDRRGKTLARAFVFDNGADEFVEDRARIVEGEGDAARYGFLARSGAIAVAPTWAWVLPYAEGLAPVCQGCVREQIGEHFTMTGGQWGYIDLDGKLVIEPRFTAAWPFAEGRARVQAEGREFEIGPDGAEVK